MFWSVNLNSRINFFLCVLAVCELLVKFSHLMLDQFYSRLSLKLLIVCHLHKSLDWFQRPQFVHANLTWRWMNTQTYPKPSNVGWNLWWRSSSRLIYFPRAKQDYHRTINMTITVPSIPFKNWSKLHRGRPLCRRGNRPKATVI